ncbi:MAG: hypothetical protein M1840_000820 [Geoglossum simile]|nr:MAG: hypothetical protein M1840_000820 [Geoglossum simile]
MWPSNRLPDWSIAFTTRNREVAVRLAGKKLVGIEEMDEEVPAQLPRSSTNHRDILKDHEAITELLEQLIYHPLALVQAAAYINENAMVLAEYLSRLNDTEENAIELLREDFEDEGRYRIAKNLIATTWLISLEQIRNRDPLAADYLSFMSCLDPKAIPESLLPPVEPAKMVVEALGTLSACSFIVRRPADKTFDLHRLVHLATRNLLREK